VSYTMLKEWAVPDEDSGVAHEGNRQYSHVARTEPVER